MSSEQRGIKGSPAPLEKLTLWLKKNLFSSPLNSIVSITLIIFILKITSSLFNWLVIDSIWNGNADLCKDGTGACLAFVKEKFIFIIFGFYPREELWRPVLGIFLFILMVIWSSSPKRWNKRIFLRWGKLIILLAILMRGGVFGFAPVTAEKWGGLPLTLMLSFFGVIVAYPLGILLALGRRSSMPIIKAICVGHIELMRGVPLISLLFMARFVFPLFFPEGITFPLLLRAQLAIILFISAYMAEVVRGGLAAIPAGQYEAADSLGLSYWHKMRFIILPQALRIVIPPTVNTIIGMFKDTSLVVIISLFDLLMATKSSLKDPEWLGFSIEGYLFVALVYYIFCFSMGSYSRRLEVDLNRGVLR
jgi:general L-amino acid transport system permease protein